jgi:hypothetical protein
MIEGGVVPRARVMDQSAIDDLLKKGLINILEHQAGEYFLSQCSKASVFVKSVNWESGGVSGGGRADHYNGIWPYAKTMRLVTKALGTTKAYVLHDVICQDRDVSNEPQMLEALREALELIANRRLTISR